jgi:F-type H+-transporting ATPase subunit b
MASMIVLFLILKNKFFDKIRNHMLKRQEAVSDSIENAVKKNIAADQLLVDYQNKLALVDEEAREKIKQAMVKAEIQSNEIINEAHRKSTEILRKANDDVEREKEQALKDLKNQIADLAIFAAEKVIEKELNTKEHHALVSKVIDDARSSQWQS